MPTNAVVRARVDEKAKKKAEKVFKSVGLTTSSAFRLLIMRTAKEKRLPFDLQPNAESVEAMRELQDGGGMTLTTVEDLMADLDADD